MNQLILSLDQCIDNMFFIKKHIKKGEIVSQHDIESTWSYLKDTGVVLSLATETTASLKYHLTEKKEECVGTMIGQKYKAYQQEISIEIFIKENQALYDMAVSYSKNLEVLCNNYRSLLSSLKSEKTHSNNGV